MDTNNKTPLIRVMLIDDDLLMLENLLQMVDWNSLGFEIVAVMENGVTALGKMDTAKPDFVITDIRMPRMDGLTFIEKVKIINPQIHILLLTAYSDFDYAKKAIALGVSNYLLKHELNAESLISELDVIKNQHFIREDTAALHNQELLEQFMIDPKNGEKKERLAQSIAGISASAWGCILLSPAVKLGGIAIGDRFTGNIEACYKIKSDISRSNVTNEILQETGCKVISIINMGRQVLVMVCLSNKAFSESHNQLVMKRIAEIIHKSVQNDNHASTLYMNTCAYNHDWFYENYREIDKYTPYVFFTGAEKEIEISALKNQIAIKSFTDEENERELQKVRELSPEESQKLATDILDCIIRGNYSIGRLRQVVSIIFEIFDGFRKKDLMSQARYNVCKDELMEAENIIEVKEYFLEVMAEITSSSNEKYSTRVRRAIQYIHENYSRDISVVDVADKLSLNPEYLNKLFKKDVGQGFSRYLMTYRMITAKILLESGEYRIGEVAQMVGYKSSQYFSVIFRQVMGASPSAYMLQTDEIKEKV